MWKEEIQTYESDVVPKCRSTRAETGSRVCLVRVAVFFDALHAFSPPRNYDWQKEKAVVILVTNGRAKDSVVRREVRFKGVTLVWLRRASNIGA